MEKETLKKCTLDTIVSLLRDNNIWVREEVVEEMDNQLEEEIPDAEYLCDFEQMAADNAEDFAYDENNKEAYAKYAKDNLEECIKSFDFHKEELMPNEDDEVDMVPLAETYLFHKEEENPFQTTVSDLAFFGKYDEVNQKITSLITKMQDVLDYYIKNVTNK